MGAVFFAETFLDGAETALEAGFFSALEGAFLAGSGFLTAAFAAGLDGFFSLGAGFFTGAFLAEGDGLTGLPEGFRDEEGLDFFFNGAQLVPKSRARKDR